MDNNPAMNLDEDINVLGDTEINVDVIHRFILTIKSDKSNKVSFFITINLGIRIVRYVHLVCS